MTLHCYCIEKKFINISETFFTSTFSVNESVLPFDGYKRHPLSIG